MKTYHVVYKFQYSKDIEAKSAEEAVFVAQHIDWDEWDETWTGPFVELETEALIENVFQDIGLYKKSEGEENE